MTIKTVGVLGAGKVGIVLAQLLLKAGYVVYIAGSGDASKIALSVKVLAPGAIAATKEDTALKSDVVILALPLGKYQTIPKPQLENKLVIDTMNHWYEVDGERDDILPADVSSSEAVQDYLDTSRVVKALSHMGYHELYDEAESSDSIVRKAIAVAGDNEQDVLIVSGLISAIGFDPLPIGRLVNGKILEPGQKGFAANLSKNALRELLIT